MEYDVEKRIKIEDIFKHKFFELYPYKLNINNENTK